MRWEFEIPGKAVPKERARTVIKDGRSVSYTPKATVAWGKAVFAYALAAGMRVPQERRGFGWVVKVAVYMHPPAGAVLSHDPTLAMGDSMEGDWDNYAKAVCDGLGDLLGNDKRVCWGSASKWYTEGRETTKVVVEGVVAGYTLKGEKR
jgi:Holliday junction resolvase RusA-like endonuclease